MKGTYDHMVFRFEAGMETFTHMQSEREAGAKRYFFLFFCPLPVLVFES